MKFLQLKSAGIAIILLALLLFAPLPATAQENRRCFPETGFCISGSIRSYWERNGGLAVFGYPITELREETIEQRWSGPVQWFERDRLEDHSNEGMGVLAGRLGARWLELQERPWQINEPLPAPPDGCVAFRETGYRLCEPFLRYWRANGGLERFGYPISPPIQEALPLGDGRMWRGTVQYFERRRMEYHPENPAPYTVQLGLLGRDTRAVEQGASPCVLPVGQLQSAANAYATRLGCPVDLLNTTAAAQLFEGGLAVWVPGAENDQNLLYVVTGMNTGSPRWEKYGVPEPASTPLNETPPAGRFAPGPHTRQIWGNDPAVRQNLGWATTFELPARGTLIRFAHGGTMMQVTGDPRVLVLLPDHRVEMAGR